MRALMQFPIGTIIEACWITEITLTETPAFPDTACWLADSHDADLPPRLWPLRASWQDGYEQARAATARPVQRSCRSPVPSAPRQRTLPLSDADLPAWMTRAEWDFHIAMQAKARSSLAGEFMRNVKRQAAAVLGFADPPANAAHQDTECYRVMPWQLISAAAQCRASRRRDVLSMGTTASACLMEGGIKSSRRVAPRPRGRLFFDKPG
jgi:hypothetical protein